MVKYWYCLHDDYPGYNNWHYSSTINGARKGLRNLMYDKMADAGVVMKERENGRTIIGVMNRAPGKMISVRLPNGRMAKIRGDRYVYFIFEKGKILDTEYTVKRDGSIEPYRRK